MGKDERRRTRFEVTYKDERGRVGYVGTLEEWGGRPPTAEELRQAVRDGQADALAGSWAEEVRK